MPGNDIQELLQTWLLKTRLPLFLRTSLYVEYQLCKQLLRVSGAVPDRDDSEEELTESESEDVSEDGDHTVKVERNVMDLAGFERSSKMSIVDGLQEPLVQPPTPSIPGSAPPSTVPGDGTQSSLHMDRFCSPFPHPTLSDSTPSFYSPCQVEFVEPTRVYSKADEGEDQPVTIRPPTPPAPDTTVYTATPEMEQPSLIPASSELFSQSVCEMLPDSQSDISSPHLWRRIYKNKNPTGSDTTARDRTPSPPLLDGSYNESFPELNITKQDRRILVGSVAAMDSFREFLARTAGEHLLNLWLDITQIEQQLGEECTSQEKCADLLRDLQDKYKTRLSSSAKERLLKREYPALRRLRDQVLRKLQGYWLPRYFQMKCANGK
eukprot:sb/3465698/